MTPNFCVVGVDTPNFHMPRLWVPVFLLWIPVILLSPVILLVLLAVWLAGRFAVQGVRLDGGVNPWRAIATLWGILCALPGTQVRVSTHEAQVQVRIL
ncbi:MAG: hypothetical protein ABSG51_01360 [Terracidiphilus sp.]|jgi:hypothetical protein